MPRKIGNITFVHYKQKPKPPEKEQIETKIESVQPIDPISIQTNPKVEQTEPNKNSGIPVVQKVEIEEPKPIEKAEIKPEPKIEPKPPRDPILDELLNRAIQSRPQVTQKKNGLFDSNKKPLFRLLFN